MIDLAVMLVLDNCNIFGNLGWITVGLIGTIKGKSQDAEDYHGKNNP